MEFHHIGRPLAAVGSRTVTAGSELHRPRNTRELSTRQEHSATVRFSPNHNCTPSKALQARATSAGASASSASMAVDAPAQASTAARASGAFRSSARAALICLIV